MAVVYVDETWSRIVPEGSPEARYGVQAKDLARLGLDPGPTEEAPKSADRPADKALRRRSDK